MRPRNSEESGRQRDLFRAQLEQILIRDHPLYRLANEVDWSVFQQEFGALYVENVGRPGLPIRWVVGLHYLKYSFKESEELVVERFLENPYWQYFCGFEYVEHKIPMDPSSLVRWRRFVSLPALARLERVPPSGDTAPRFDALRRRQAVSVMIAGIFGALALIGGVLHKY